MCHVIDDFLGINPPGDAAEEALSRFLALCDELGIPVALKKTEKGFCMIFLGVELDTAKMQASLPEEKLCRLRAMLEKYSKAKSVTVRELQSLTGLLNFACSVVVPEKPFMRRMCLAFWKLHNPSPFKKLKVTRGMIRDMELWLVFLRGYNGISMFLPEQPIADHVVQLFTASSGQCGFGVVFGTHWCMGTWPEAWKKTNFLMRSMFPVLVAFKCFGPMMKNCKILMYFPHQILVKIVNAQSAKDPLLMHIVRSLVLVLLCNNIELVAEWGRHVWNPAVCLSQGDVAQYRRLVPDGNLAPAEIPSSFLPSSFSATWGPSWRVV